MEGIDFQVQFLVNLGKNITLLRKKKGLKQTDLAYKCNMEKSNLIRIEKGRTNPTSLTLFKLAKVLNIKVSAFFENTD